MATPKIKVYQLPTGYSEEGDNDIQEVTNDEILPIKEKPIVPDDAYPMTGVGFVTKGSLYPLDTTTGLVEEALSDVGGGDYQASNSGLLVEVDPSSHYAPKAYDQSMILIDPSGYSVNESGLFSFTTAPSGTVSAKYWLKDTAPVTDWVGEFDKWWDGNNEMFTETLFDADDSDDPYEKSEYTLVPASGLVQFNSAQNNPTATYTHEQTVTRFFVADRENWVGEHMRMNPDIFKGEFDYPGDDSEDEFGSPIIQGPIPEFVEKSQYQIDFRKGLITFPEEFDSSIDEVKASYTYLVGIRNVTSQVLDQIAADPSGGYVYQAISEKVYPESHSARWVNRDNSYTPINFYVDGEITPQLTTVTPYDTLTVKTG